MLSQEIQENNLTNQNPRSMAHQSSIKIINNVPDQNDKDLNIEAKTHNKALENNYSSQRQFKQLTKNIKRLDGTKGRNYTSINQSIEQSNANHQDVQVFKSPSIIQSSASHFKELKKSASGKYFTLTKLEEMEDLKSNRQSLLRQNPTKQPAVQNPLVSLKFEATSKQDGEERPLKRFKPLVTVLVFQVVINILFMVPALYMFFTLDSVFKRNLATTQYALITIFYICSSAYIVWGHGRKGLVQFIMMHFLLDTMFLILIVVTIGFIGMLTVYFSNEWFQYVNLIGIPIMNFFFIGNFRLFLKWTKLKPWQIIIWKITFFIDGMAYFGIGAYYMAVNYKLTGGYLPEVESKLKDFCLLFVFANFSLYVQMYGAIGSKDKTEDLEYKYLMNDDPDSQQSSSQIIEGKCKHCKHCQQIHYRLNDQIRLKQKIQQLNQSIVHRDDLNIQNKQKDNKHKKKLFEIVQQSPIGKQQTLKQEEDKRIIGFDQKNLKKLSGKKSNKDSQRMFFTINKLN